MFKTSNGKVINIEELNWQEASVLLNPVLPELVGIIEQLSPGPEFVFYKASYPFGERIIEKTEAYLPLNNGGSISFNDPSLPKSISDNLSYNPQSSNPLGIILNKNSEFYLSTHSRVMPYMMASPGHIFGLSRALDNAIREDHMSPSSRSPLIYDLNAGARSVFMLPKISDNLGYAKLNKDYNLVLSKPKSYEDHWEVFREIAAKSQSAWRAEVLFFSNNWLEKLRDPNWISLFGYFSKLYKLSDNVWHNIQSWEATFSRIQHEKKLEHYSAYTLDTVQHLFTIAANSAPAFRPAIDDNSAPVKLLQEIFSKGYGLTEYYPIIMEIAQFSKSYSQPLYYSLCHATLPQYNPEKYKGKTILNLQFEVQRSVEIYQTEILNNPKLIPLSLFNAASSVNFDFFHHDPGISENVRPSSELGSEDQRFLITEYPGVFPNFSAFLNGCIKLSPVH